MALLSSRRLVVVTLLLAAIMLLHAPVTTAQELEEFSVQESLQETCVLVGCCLDDCCSAGTSWDIVTKYCIANSTSFGFDGEHIEEYTEGCMSRLCCNEDCCGSGTRYDTESESCVAVNDGIVNVNFVQASPDNVLLLESLHHSGDTPSIQVETTKEASVYAVDESDIFSNLIDGGKTCRGLNTIGALEKDQDNVITLPLNGKDVVIYVCVANVLVGRCIHFYTDNPNQVRVDFGRASPTNFVSLQYQYLYAFQSGRGYARITGCRSENGCSLYYKTGESSGGSGGGFASSSSLSTGGDGCPPEGTEVLPNDAGFSLFLVEGDAVIYACSNGVAIARCVFRSGPSPPATMSGAPSLVPSNAPSSLPTVSPTRAPTTLDSTSESPSPSPTFSGTDTSTNGVAQAMPSAIPTRPPSPPPTFPTPLSAGEACASANDCESNACGFEFFDTTSDFICCPSNETERIPNRQRDGKTYCTGQAVGNACGTNTQCSSGVCVAGICLVDKQIVGDTCDSGDHDDCANAACGFAKFDTSSTEMICCPSNETERIPNRQRDGRTYCTGQAAGETCGSNTQCSSGVCVAGICLEEKQDSGGKCDRGDNDDCANSACGFAKFNTSATEMICCPSNEILRIPNRQRDGRTYCSGQAVGDACGASRQCSSGVCEANICVKDENPSPSSSPTASVSSVLALPTSTEATPATTTAAPPTIATTLDSTSSPTAAMNGAPGSSNQGTDFYVLETPTFTCGQDSFAIAIANPSDEPANVVIENPGSSTSTSITIPVGNLTNTRFPCMAIAGEGNSIGLRPVYRIRSDVNVVAYAFVEYGANSDASLLLPVHALGMRYRAGSYKHPLNSLDAIMGAVAVEDETSISFFDASGALIDSRVTIDQGQVLQRRQAEDMTGWRIVADKPVAAFSGNVCTSVGDGFAGCDALYEQLLPEESLASSYVACPTLTRPIGCEGSSCAPDIFRYIAIEDDTVITLEGKAISESQTLSAGEYFELTTANPHTVNANKPLYVFQYLISRESGVPIAKDGDPAMTQLIPVDQFLTEYTFLTVPGSVSNFVNVVAEVGTSLTLDGQDVADECIDAGAVDGSDFCCLQIPVDEGVHTITSSEKGFGLVVSGFVINGSYAYAGGAGFAGVNNGSRR